MKIEIDRLTKTFHGGSGPVTTLEDLDFSISENQFVTVVGPSGCGKSTLMNCIAGLEAPTSGEVRVDGKSVKAPSPERGVIFQQYALFPWLSVRQNVEFGLKLKGIPHKERSATADRYMDLVGLKDFANALPKELSGGMKQRCAIARAYAVNPSILLMDEPFGALDALTKVKLQDGLLETWMKEKKTVFFITHDVDEAVYLSNRVMVMSPRPGQIKDLVEVDLPYPRTEQMRLSGHFAQLRNRVWTGVYH